MAIFHMKLLMARYIFKLIFIIFGTFLSLEVQEKLLEADLKKYDNFGSSYRQIHKCHKNMPGIFEKLRFIAFQQWALRFPS